MNEIDRALDVNLRAPMVLAKQLAPAMVAKGRGHLLFVSSLLGKFASPGAAVYSATKYGLRGFAGPLREDLRGAGVGVSVVFPGFIRDAGMFADAKVDLPPGVGTSSPDEVAAASSPRSRRTAARSMSRRCPCDWSPRWAAWLPVWCRRPATLGADKVTAKVAEGQRDKR